MDPLPEVCKIGNDKLGSSNDGSERKHAINVFTEGGTTGDVCESNFERYENLSAAKFTELMNLGGFENVSTQSLFSAANRTLDECVKSKKGDIPQCVASILQFMVQEIQHRFLTQAKNFNKQNTLYKSREEKYLLKHKVFKTLLAGTNEENEIARNLLQQTKIEKSKIEKTKKCQEEELTKLRVELDRSETQVLSIERELKLAQKAYEEKFFLLEIKAKESKENQLKKILELEGFLADSRNKIEELQHISESNVLRWKRKEQRYWQFIDSHFRSLQQIRMASDSMKQEVLKINASFVDEFYHFAASLKVLTDAAHNYHSVLEENRKLYNEVQDLKGNIRVYCRIRPFLPGQTKKQTAVEYIGENGELVVTKPGKDIHRLFKFNKVFGPASTQEEVFQDTQPLIRSVLDGYNVCIFAYGQTGSGKTYTMTGPNGKSIVDCGVNYRALKDLFNISQSRSSSINYEIGVQMVEIYNEQVRDLLCNDSLPKRLGIWNASQPNGLAVPDASMYPVKSITDVLELMNVGLMNRAVGATALNERSSRSHSILTVHVRGADLETNTVLHGCLHLVDLAGSERVDRSEATGDRLREAQHINKSLSALGDVIFALAQKTPHVPYRNSKLTQVLQSSLGGQAKTLMFVQLNPDVESYAETISTLKFAERVSGVELGAARSNKEGKGVRELVEQVASLKEALAQKDEEIGRLQLLKAYGNREGHSSVSSQQGSLHVVKNSSDCSNKHSEAGSPQSIDEIDPHDEIFRHIGREEFPKYCRLGPESADGSENLSTETQIPGYANDYMKIGEVPFIGAETDCSSSTTQDWSHSIVKSSADATEKLNVSGMLPRPPIKQGHPGPSQSCLGSSAGKVPGPKRTTTGSSPAIKQSKRRP